MKTLLRVLAMAATFAGLFALSWYFFVHERSQRVPDPEPKLQPQAKTTAELLVGTWRLVQAPDGTIPEDWAITLHFSQDGGYAGRVQLPPALQQHSTEAVGTYRLHGMTITFSEAATPEIAAKTWQEDIEFISEDELRTLSGSGEVLDRRVWRKQR